MYLHEYMRKPFNGNYVVSRGFGGLLIPNDAKYGTHKGTDWALPTGTPLVAAISGTVTYASWATDAGNTVTIKNGPNLYKCFHMSRIDVTYGQQIQEGQPIGLSGATGNVTGPHVHFQVEVPAGNAVDPMPLITDEGDDMSVTDLGLRKVLAFGILGLNGEGIGERRPNAANPDIDATLGAEQAHETNQTIWDYWNSEQAIDYRNKELPAVYALANKAVEYQRQLEELKSQGSLDPKGSALLKAIKEFVQE